MRRMCKAVCLQICSFGWGQEPEPSSNNRALSCRAGKGAPLPAANIKPASKKHLGKHLSWEHRPVYPRARTEQLQSIQWDFIKATSAPACECLGTGGAGWGDTEGRGGEGRVWPTLPRGGGAGPVCTEYPASPPPRPRRRASAAAARGRPATASPARAASSPRRQRRSRSLSSSLLPAAAAGHGRERWGCGSRRRQRRGGARRGAGGGSSAAGAGPGLPRVA